MAFILRGVAAYPAATAGAGHAQAGLDPPNRASNDARSTRRLRSASW